MEENIVEGDLPAVEDTFARLGTSEKGLSEQQISERLEKYGNNELTETKKTTAWKIFTRQFADFIVWVLIAAAIISLLADEVINFWVIVFIIALVIILGFIQEYRAEKAMESLKDIVKPETTVIRDNKPRNVQTRGVVPGDVLVLEVGDNIPADAVVFKSDGLRIEEAALTGESEPVWKDVGDQIFAGTQIVHGKCRAVVVSTGMETKIGEIAGLIQVEDEPTPLQKKVANLSKNLAVIALLASLATFVLGLFIGAPLTEILLVALALAVAAVPQGLPLVMTITLAYGMRRMAQHNAIIRKMLAVETLGSTTVICTDKTGTLTRNEMTVEKVFVSNKTFEVSGSGYAPDGEFLVEGGKADIGQGDTAMKLLRAAALCNASSIEKRDGKWDTVGDPTEIALVVAAAKAGLWKDDLEKEYPMIDEIAFTSERKLMTTVHTREDGRVSYTKGAPEYVLERCTRIEKDGKVTDISDDDRRSILDMNREMASSAYRVLGIACTEDPGDPSKEDIEQNMTFLGLIGMIDPPRDEVKNAVELSRQAGIKVLMITGDNPDTAKAIARHIGLLDSGSACGSDAEILNESDKKVQRIITDCVVTGPELDELDNEELEKIVDKISVYARTMPEQKLRIVEALQKKGHIVAMTGDGVNDAPALKKADIGIAMGLKGTDVAQQSSLMVLQDDNFATIVEAVKRGRSIYENIEKFTTYLISRNFTEVTLIMLGLLLLGFDLIPLLALQILFINMFDEIMPAIALGLDPAREKIMDKMPRDPNESLLKKRNVMIMVSMAAVMASSAFLVFVLNDPAENTTIARTLTFATIVSMILFIPFSFRSLEESITKIGIFSNKLMIVGVLSTVLLTLSVMYIPFLNNIFELVPLTPMQWILPLGVAFVTLIFAEGIKIAVRNVK
ncbi:MAG: cation-translocating P-type ATPase [Methanolobus sp.]|uniref:cation-translocating P-type ATPase n=1 Tax=Methanolobus sp. TaxID=1874737 RepID=UPI00272FAA75|nr:cation-translocating P-type ATPase [Methanolobus sp.]MDP2216651.1 cation-translocating P-type ATPase [Methanolobus sp.]